MAEVIGEALVEFRTDDTALDRGLSEAERKVRVFQRNVEQSFLGMGGPLTVFGGLLTGVTLAIGGVATAGVKLASDFEKQFSRIAALTGTPRAALQGLRGDLLELSRITARTPEELGAGLYFVLSSGISDTAKAMEVLRLSATASAAGLGETQVIADVLTSVMNAYKLSTDEAAKATDTLINIVKFGKGEPEEFAESLGRVIPFSAQLGISFEQLGAVLSTLTNIGLDAAEATTAVRAIMSAIARPTKDAAELWASLGLSMEEVRERAGQNFVQFFLDVTKALDGNVAAIATLFPNVRGMIGALGAFARQGDATFQNLRNIEQGTGALALAFEEMQRDPAFKLEQAMNRLRVSLTEFGIVLLPIASAALDALSPLLGVLERVVGLFAALPRPIQLGVIAVAGLVAALGPLLLIAGLSAFTLNQVAVAMIRMGIASPTAVASVGGLTAAMGRLSLTAALATGRVVLMGGAAAALGVGIALLITRFDDVQDALARGREEFDLWISRLEDAGLNLLGFVTGTLEGAARIISTFVAEGVRFGADLMLAMAHGVAAGATVLYRTIGLVVQQAGQLLNPFNWRPGSTLIQVYARAGEEAGDALMEALRRTLERNVRSVVDVLRAPLSAMRDVLGDLFAEMRRLAGLSTVESAREAVQLAELRLRALGLEPRAERARRQRERELERFDDQLSGLNDQLEDLRDRRSQLGDFTPGQMGFPLQEALDRQIEALEREVDVTQERRDQVEASRSTAERELEAIENQIEALERLGRQRELERELILARGQAADRTLATDHLVLSAMGRLVGEIGSVSGAIRAQVADLQTLFIPSWDQAVGLMDEAAEAASRLTGREPTVPGAAEGAGAGAGAGVGGLEVPEVPPTDFDALTEQIRKDIEKAQQDIETEVKGAFLDNLPTILGVAFGSGLLLFRGKIGAILQKTGLGGVLASALPKAFSFKGAGAGVGLGLAAALTSVTLGAMDLAQGDLSSGIAQIVGPALGAGIGFAVGGPAGYAIGAGVGSLVGQLAAQWAPELEAFFTGPFVGFFTGPMADVFGTTIPAFFTQTVPGMLEPFTSFFTQTLAGFFGQQLPQFFTQAVPDFFEPFTSTFTETLADFFGQTLPAFFTQTVPSAVAGLATAFVEAVQAFFTPENIGSRLADLVAVAVISMFAAPILIIKFREEIGGFFQAVGGEFLSFLTDTLPGFIAGNWRHILTALFPVPMLIMRFREEIGGFLRTAGERFLQFLVDDVPGFIGDQWVNILTALFPVPMLITRFRDEIGGFFQTAGAAFVSFLTETVPGFIGDNWRNILTALFPVPMLITRFRGEIGGFFQAVGGEFLSFLTETLPGFIGDNWRRIVTALFPPLLAFEFRREIGGALETAGEAIMDWVGGIAGWLTENMNPWGWVKTAWDAFVERIKEWLNWVWGGSIVEDWVEGIAGWLTENMNPWNWVKAGFDLLITGVSGAFGRAWGAISGEVSQWPGRVWSLLSSLPGRIGDLFGLVKDTALGVVESFWTGFTEWMVWPGGRFWQEVRGALVSVVTFFGERFDAVREMVLGRVSALWTGFTEWMAWPGGRFWAEVRNALFTVRDFFGERFDAVRGAVLDRVSALWGGLKEWFSWPGGRLWQEVRNSLFAVKDFFVDSWNSIKNFFTNNVRGFFTQTVPGWFTEMGGKIFEGIRNALTGAAGLAGDMATTFWNAIKNFINTRFINRINSFIDTIRGIGAFGVKPFSGLPKILPLHQGGIVPGRPGEEVLALLEARELVVPRPVADVLRRLSARQPALDTLAPAAMFRGGMTEFRSSRVAMERFLETGMIDRSTVASLEAPAVTVEVSALADERVREAVRDELREVAATFWGPVAFNVYSPDAATAGRSVVEALRGF